MFTKHDPVYVQDLPRNHPFHKFSRERGYVFQVLPASYRGDDRRDVADLVRVVFPGYTSNGADIQEWLDETIICHDTRRGEHDPRPLYEAERRARKATESALNKSPWTGSYVTGG